MDPARGCTPLSWLAEPATVASGRGIHTQFEKLRFLDTLGADRWDVTALVPNRRRGLDQVKRRTNQALARMRPERRRPILVAFGAERRVELIDELVELADQVVERSVRAGNALDELKKTVAVAAADKVALFTRLARLVLDPRHPRGATRAVSSTNSESSDSSPRWPKPTHWCSPTATPTSTCWRAATPSYAPGHPNSWTPSTSDPDPAAPT